MELAELIKIILGRTENLALLICFTWIGLMHWAHAQARKEWREDSAKSTEAIGKCTEAILSLRIVLAAITGKKDL